MSTPGSIFASGSGSAVLYLFPGLHPDGYEDGGSGWPRALKRFAVEA